MSRQQQQFLAAGPRPAPPPPTPWLAEPRAGPVRENAPPVALWQGLEAPGANLQWPWPAAPQAPREQQLRPGLEPSRGRGARTPAKAPGHDSAASQPGQRSQRQQNKRRFAKQAQQQQQLGQRPAKQQLQQQTQAQQRQRPAKAISKRGGQQRGKRPKPRPVTPWNCPWAPKHSPAHGGEASAVLRSPNRMLDDVNLEEGFGLVLDGDAEEAMDSGSSCQSGVPSSDAKQVQAAADEEDTTSQASQLQPSPEQQQASYLAELEGQVAALTVEKFRLQQRVHALEQAAAARGESAITSPAAEQGQGASTGPPDAQPPA